MTDLTVTRNATAPAVLVESPGEAKSHFNYRPDIDGLRAVAVVLVVLYHAGVPGFTGGYVGVDVFFVISGYLITSVLLRQGMAGQLNLSAFYAGRMRRLLPQSMLTLVTTVGFGLWLLPVSRSNELLDDAQAAVIFLSNWRFANKSVAYVDTLVTEGLLTHFWSLSIEEQYYLAWPLLIAFLSINTRRLRRYSLRHVVGYLSVVVVTISLAASLLYTSDEGARAYYSTPLRLWEIATGAVVAAFFRFPRQDWGVALRMGSMLAIVIASLSFGNETPFPGSAALVPVIATALMLILGGNGDSFDRALGSRPLRYVGSRSYALYLWHWPALGFVALLGERYHLDYPRWFEILIAICLTVIVSFASHRFIENPIRRSQRLSSNILWTLAVGSLATLSFAMAIAPTKERNIARAGEDWRNAYASPNEATKDTVTALYGSCHQGIREFKAFDWCVLGDPEGSVTIALAGDSHAQNWAPAFHTAGVTNGWRVLLATRSSCIPYDLAIYSRRAERIDTGCRIWGESIRTSLVGFGAVDLLVLARAFNYIELVRSDDGSEVNRDAAADMISAAVTSFVREVDRSVKRFVILKDTPWAPTSVTECLDLAGPTHASRCDFSLQLRDMEVEFINAEQQGLDTSGALGSVDSLNEAVCPGALCRAVLTDGTITFRDTSHFTATFSRTLSPAVEAFVRAQLER